MLKQEIQRRIDECTKKGWWYQPMIYDGIKVPCRNRPYEYFGLGRWNNFVAPHITPDVIGNGLFAEFGCNAGMYLMEALYAGFETVYGIDAAIPAYSQLQLTKDFHDKCDIRTIFAAIGKLEKNIANSHAPQFSFDRFPIVDLTLLANVTYWIEDQTLREFAKQLAYKSKRVIITVAKDAKNYDNWNNCFDVEDWKLKKIINNGGHSGERQMFSILLESKRLIKLDVDDLFEKHVLNTPANKKFYIELWPAFVDEPNLQSIKYIYGWLEIGANNTTKYNDKDAMQMIYRWINLVRDMKQGIMLEPIELTGKTHGDYFDGFHRVATAKQLGWKYIYAKKKESV